MTGSGGGWLEWWLSLAARLVPRDERARWLEEWRAELESTRARGVPWTGRLALAMGVAVAAIRFHWEDGTMEGWGREVRHALRGLLRRLRRDAVGSD